MAPRAKRTSSKAKAKASSVIEIIFGDDYEPPTTEYFGEEPRAGVYRFKAVQVQKHTKEETGSESIHWTLACQDEPYIGWAGHVYTGLPGSESFFRTQHMVRALQSGKTKDVKLDLDNPEAFLKKAAVVLGRVVSEEYGGDMRGKLTRVAPDDGTVKSTKPLDEDEDEDDDGFDDDEDDELDEDEDEEEEDEDEDEDEEDEEEEDDDDEDEEDEEDEDEEPPAPPARKRAAKGKAKAAPAPAKKAAKKAVRRKR